MKAEVKYLVEQFRKKGAVQKGEETVNKNGVKYRYDLTCIKNPTGGLMMAFERAARASGRAKFINGHLILKDGFRVGEGREHLTFSMRANVFKGSKVEQISMHEIIISEG